MDREGMVATAHNAECLAKRAGSRFEDFGSWPVLARRSCDQACTAHACRCRDGKQVQDRWRDVDDAGWCLTQSGASAPRSAPEDEHGIEFVPVQPAMHAAADRHTTGDQAEARQAVLVCVSGWPTRKALR